MRARTTQIRQLYATLSTRDLAGRRKITGIGPRRAEIVIPGAAVFLKVLEGFQHHSIYYSTAGVRDGIIADFEARGVGRELSQLSNEQRKVVEAMAKRYGVSMKHIQKVAQMAVRLFEVSHPIHNLPPAAGKLLHAAAYLHDIGHFVSDTGHHKHSAYLVANSDMPGFTNRERFTIATLCQFHRKSMPQPRHANFQALDADAKRTVLLLAPLLRLADCLDRGHRQRVHDLKGQIKNGGFVIQVSAEKDADLEVWAANNAAGAFQQVYGIPVSIQRAR
jgi:exopolyphosphatase/guanosine-5'-triphosphate,3'-diphosphate pyrophosphatase